MTDEGIQLRMLRSYIEQRKAAELADSERRNKYSSHLATRRAARDRGELAGVSKKLGPLVSRKQPVQLRHPEASPA